MIHSTYSHPPVYSTYSHPPALGFQVNPFDVLGGIKDADCQKLTRFGLIDIITPTGKGLHNAYSYYFSDGVWSSPRGVWSSPRKSKDVFAYESIRNSNYSKIAGYIPAIGTLIGAGRIIGTIKDENLPIKNKVAHILRGTVEFLSLGVLLLIPDLILTNFRTFHAKLAPANDFSSLVYLDPYPGPDSEINVKILKPEYVAEMDKKRSPEQPS